jgi:ubiquinone/menaquinone biosynthesis C-methylase UbiE
MNIREMSYSFYDSARKFIAPSLLHSQSLYENVLESHVNHQTRWLDLGCGHQVLPSWRLEQERKLVGRCRSVVGLDYDTGSLKAHKTITERVRGSITDLPFASGHFDLVTANMVVEHLDDPEAQFQEVYRVLKPGGLFIFHTPNALGYLTIGARLVPDRFKDRLVYLLDGRSENDVFDTHYKANTRKRIAELAQTSGFEVTKIKMLVSEAGFMFVPPLAVPELVWIRLLMIESLKPLRTTIIAILKKPNDWFA